MGAGDFADRLTRLCDDALRLLTAVWLLDDACRNLDGFDHTGPMIVALVGRYAALDAARGEPEWLALADTHTAPLSQGGADGLSYVELVLIIASQRFSRIVHDAHSPKSDRARQALERWVMHDAATMPDPELLAARWPRISKGLRKLLPFERARLEAGIRKEHRQAVLAAGMQVTGAESRRTAVKADIETDTTEKEEKKRREWNSDARDCLRRYKAALSIDPGESLRAVVKAWAAELEGRSVTGMLRRFREYPEKWKGLKKKPKRTRSGHR